MQNIGLDKTYNESNSFWKQNLNDDLNENNVDFWKYILVPNFSIFEKFLCCKAYGDEI